jgi:hypothetical protein
MKPLSQISLERKSHRGEEMPVELRRKHPATDCHYQPTGGSFRVANERLKQSTPAPSPSFRQLSRKFLADEMKRDYLTEAFCFLIIAGVSAWPIVSMVRSLSLLK